MASVGQTMEAQFYLFQTGMGPNHQSRRDGRPGWPSRETRAKNMESGTRDSRRLLSMRYQAALIFIDQERIRIPFSELLVSDALKVHVWECIRKVGT